IILVQRVVFFFFSSRRRHTRSTRDWSSDVCSSDLYVVLAAFPQALEHHVRVQEQFVPTSLQQLVDLVGSQPVALDQLAGQRPRRSEERRVGKEGRSQRATAQLKQTEKSNTRDR